MKNRFLVFLLLVSSLAYGDRMQNDNIDMQGNAIKNADVQGGTASDTSRITVPKAATATLDGLTRKEGTVVFDSTTKKLKVDNGTTLSPVGSGEGGGGLNAVTNPTAATDLTGYSDSDADAAGNDYIRTDTAAELPLSPAVTTGVKIVPDASSEYIAYCGTMPEALQNRKLRFNQFQKVESGYDSGDMRLEIYPSTSSTCASVGTEYALNKDSSGVTAIPSATQDFWVTFDADGSDYFQIRWVRTNASAEYIVVQNVSIGTGDMPTGPPKYDNQTVTMTSGFTNATVTAKESRNGAWATYEVNVVTTGTPVGTLTISLPSGRTIDSSAIPSGGDSDNMTLGRASLFDGATDFDAVVAYNSTSNVIIRSWAASGSFVSTAASVTASSPFSWGSADEAYIRFSVPIAEWGDSSNVVQYGQQDVEYASNDGSGGTSAGGDYSTGSVAGQAGSNFVAVASTTSASATRYKVSFQSPILATDLLVLEVYQSGYWGVGNIATTQRIFQGASQYGFWWEINDATSVKVAFGNMGSRPDNATYAGVGTAWSTWTGGSYKWRVKKISGNALGGFQYATSAAHGIVKLSDSNGDTGKVPSYKEGTWTPSTDSLINMTGTATYGTAKYTVIGRKVFVSIDSISGLSITSSGARTVLIINTTGLPGLVNGTKPGGSSYVLANSNSFELAAPIVDASGSDTDVALAWVGQGTGAATFSGVTFSYDM